MQGLVDSMRSQGPWFDRKAGKDHILIVPHEYGRCDVVKEVAYGALKNTIMVHHFGMVREAGGVSTCNMTQLWGAECDPWFQAARQRLQQPDPYQPCHFMDQDIVVPPPIHEDPHTNPYLNSSWLQPLMDHKRYNLFFAGLVEPYKNRPDVPTEPWSDTLYSFGARQNVARMYRRNSTFLRLHEGHVANYTAEMTSSKFCLATAGWGWGSRMKVAISHGCIPVVVQDGIRVEWEEQLPLEQYAIRIPMWLVHKLPEIIDVYLNTSVVGGTGSNVSSTLAAGNFSSNGTGTTNNVNSSNSTAPTTTSNTGEISTVITTSRYARMQKALGCVWRLHWWERPHGRAFEMLMCTLKARLMFKKPSLDTEKCAVQCGDGRWVNITELNWV